MGFLSTMYQLRLLLVLYVIFDVSIYLIYFLQVFIEIINPYQVNVSFLYHVKMSENQRFIEMEQVLEIG